MDVRLVVQKGGARQRTWLLHRQNTVVGRRRDCDLRILSSEVSRRHCLLSIADGYVGVEDLDSINGTFVNGSRVLGRQILRPGDHLEIGPLEFIVEYELPPEPIQLEQQPELAEEPNALDESEEHEFYDVLPLARQNRRSTSEGKQEEVEELAVVQDEDEAGDWHLPQTNELRELLSQLDQPESRPPRRKR